MTKDFILRISTSESQETGLDIGSGLSSQLGCFSVALPITTAFVFFFSILFITR